MKPRRVCSMQWLLLALAASVATVHCMETGDTTSSNAINTTSTSSSSQSTKYISTNAPDCDASLSQTIVMIYGRNRNIYTQCAAESHEYSLFPYSGYLPSDQQLTAMVASPSCLYFIQAVLSIPALRECNLGGLDLKSAMETLLMTSQDTVNGVEPLTSHQFLDFITWRHTRNIAQEINEPYDATSESAAAFERQLKDAALRLNLSLTDSLHIQVNGSVVGTSQSSSESELRSADGNDPLTMVKSSSGKTSVEATETHPTSSAATSSVAAAVAWAVAFAFGIVGQVLR